MKNYAIIIAVLVTTEDPDKELKEITETLKAHNPSWDVDHQDTEEIE